MNPKTAGLQCSKRLQQDKSCCLWGCTHGYATFRRSKLPRSSRPKTFLPYRRRNLFLRNVGPQPQTCMLTRNKTAAFIHRCVNLKPRNSVTKYRFLTSGPFIRTARCPRTDFFFRYHMPSWYHLIFKLVGKISILKTEHTVKANSYIPDRPAGVLCRTFTFVKVRVVAGKSRTFGQALTVYRPSIDWSATVPRRSLDKSLSKLSAKTRSGCSPACVNLS